MKKIILSTGSLFICIFSIAQNVGIGTPVPNASAQLDISSNNKGVLLPRMGASQRIAISSPAKGLLVYDTTYSSFFYHDGGRWMPIYQPDYDSAITDLSVTATAETNIPFFGYTSIFADNGILYDNGGPSGNYSPDCSGSYYINDDESDLGVKLTVEYLNAETNYDSLFIFDDAGLVVGLSGNQTGTYIGIGRIQVHFRSNNIQQFAGFKIRWGRLKPNANQLSPIPQYGWQFISAKSAIMGGLHQGDNWNPDSVGFTALGYGYGVKAKGFAATAFGRNTFAIGDYSMASGRDNIASGSGSIAIGTSNTSSSFVSTAIGYNNHASGFNSTAMGAYNSAAESYSTVMGYSSTASAFVATALGYFNVASGQYSTAMGSSNAASGQYSTAMGYSNRVSGLSATVMGNGNKAKSDNSVVIGKYNDTTALTGYSKLVMGQPIMQEAMPSRFCKMEIQVSVRPPPMHPCKLRIVF